MAFDEKLADRVRGLLKKRVIEKKMFGGLAFLLDGRMCCGILGDDLVVRVSSDECDAMLKKPHVRPMDFTGRPMKGFIYVGPKGYANATDLRRWIESGVSFVENAPKKRKRRRKR